MPYHPDPPARALSPSAATRPRTEAHPADGPALDAWIVSDPAGRVLYATDAACRMLGTTVAGLREASADAVTGPAPRVRQHVPAGVCSSVLLLEDPEDPTGGPVPVRLATRRQGPASLITVLEPLRG
jgi:PAS domain-containing protein